MSGFTDETQFRWVISATLASNPDWLSAALEGIAHGMRGALERSNEARAKADRAMMAALILGGDKRVDADTRKEMNSIVCEAIHSKHASQIEREYLAKQPLNPGDQS